jgi:endonuclease/exonuclease/phosphatase family metal-dependent hydrolase
MTVERPKTMIRVLVGVLSLGVMLAPVLVSSSGTAASQDPKYRKVSAPNVFYPVRGTKAVKDRKTYSRRHRGTDIAAPCNAGVYATHPGVAQVRTSPAWNGRFVVRIVSNSGGLVTGYAFLSRALVKDGQLIQSGQAIGLNGRNPRSRACDLYFTVYRGGVAANPTSWLSHYVGLAPPVPSLFGTKGFDLASFNMLGASHTVSSSRYSTYPSRLVRAAAMFDARGLDVIGTQEFQERQFDYFVAKGFTKTWGAYYWDPAGTKRDTENLILWRKSTMEFISATTFDIPYFYGQIRHIPAVLLRERSTGRTAYFLNTHNASNVRGNAARYRAQAIAIEKAKIIQLRSTGRPVFLTGDFNDRQPAFCPLTANKLAISPNSIPSTSCAYPQQWSIDWIFAAGQARFSQYARDAYPQNARISDHPIVQTRVHLQN